ncbi:MAG TPA: extracellular solute-binding protein [Candidatus Limnocylindrales bacterium]|nr:extracellular solute-binding protein [Candidatus Limnocylindrales bacterium]
MRRFLSLAATAVLVAAACTPAPAATGGPSAAPATGGTPTTAPASQGAANPEAIITGVEDGAEIGFWTFYLSPTFDDYIKGTIARFNEAYPGVKVNWEDHQATFQDDLKNAFNAGNAPDVINLSVSEGWVSDYATQGKLLALDSVPDSVKSLYFEGLWNEQLVDGKNYQFPWYQGINVNLINTQIFQGTPKVDADGKITYEGGAGLDPTKDFPKTIDGIPALCKTIKDKTGKLCDVRLTVNDLLSQMVYEGNVKVIGDDGKFAFNSAEAVAWLNMYKTMVDDKSVDRNALITDQDRVGLDLFTSGEAPFYATGPNLIREVRTNNPGLYGYLAVQPSPLGKSGVAGKGLMSISVKGDTKFPNASIALAQFFTNPRSMLEFAQQVAVYPSTPSSYDDPFFSATPVAIEDSAKPIAKDTIATYKDIVPTIPHKADVNQLVLDAVQQALFDGKDPQKALDDAVAAANALLP